MYSISLGFMSKMAEQDTKNEFSKEVLAPPQGIRDDLVSTAVKFLQNPKVTQSPLSQKKAFLQRKGLTDEEIEAAIQKSGVNELTHRPAVTGSNTDMNRVGNMTAMAPVIPQKTEVYSKWMRARDMIAVISVVTGMSYAAYKLYKELIRPMLFGIPSTEQRLHGLEKNMSESIEKISQTLASIEQMLGKQEEKLQILSHDVNSKTNGSFIDAAQKETSISELKAELVSLKGLLLNRRQFPPVPTSAPALPAWQLTHEAGDNLNSNEKGRVNDVTRVQSPDISSSPTASPVSETGESDSGNIVKDKQYIDNKSSDQSTQDLSQAGTSFSSDTNDKLGNSGDSIDANKVTCEGLSTENSDIANRKSDGDLNKDDEDVESNESLD